MKIIAIILILMQIGMLYADDKNIVQKAESQARAYGKFLLDKNYEEFCYVGTVGQYLLPQFRDAGYIPKYISSKGATGSIEELPPDALVILGRRISSPSSILLGGCGYFYCDSKSGEVIGFTLMK